MDWFTKIPTEALYVFIAAVGGCARYLQNYIQEDEFSLKHMFAHLFVSAFSGYMFYQFSHSLSILPLNLEPVLAGMGGWMGVAALQFLEKILKNRISK